MIVPLAGPTPTPNPTPDLSTATESTLGWGPGLLSLVAFILLGVATYLIWKYLNGSLSRVDFEESPPPGGTPSG